MNARWEKTAVLFLGSQCVTLFGSTLVQMAIVWYVTLPFQWRRICRSFSFLLPAAYGQTAIIKKE